MQKKDLKTGMVVELKNGDLRLVVGANLFNKDGYQRNEVKNYNDDLTYPRDCIGLKIIAVYNDFDKSKCLWKRVEFKKDQLKNGAVVKTREGTYYMKVDELLVNLKYGTYLKFNRYDDKLKFRGDYCFDIVEVNNVEKMPNEPYLDYINGCNSRFIKINEG